MASILMCDSCGKVSTDMGSKVFVHLHPSLIQTVARTANVRRPDAMLENMAPDHEKDFCRECTERLLEPRTIRVLSASPEEL